MVTETPANISAERVVAAEIRRKPGVQGGSACIGNTRIPVWLLVGYRQNGISEAELLESYPTLSLEHLASAWAHYATHQGEIDEDLRLDDDDD